MERLSVLRSALCSRRFSDDLKTNDPEVKPSMEERGDMKVEDAVEILENDEKDWKIVMDAAVASFQEALKLQEMMQELVEKEGVPATRVMREPGIRKGRAAASLVRLLARLTSKPRNDGSRCFCKGKHTPPCVDRPVAKTVLLLYAGASEIALEGSWFEWLLRIWKCEEIEITLTGDDRVVRALCELDTDATIDEYGEVSCGFSCPVLPEVPMLGA